MSGVSAKKHKREYDVEKDNISRLPDEVVLSIVSLLSMKEAARTSVLARRWRTVWTFIPTLNFDASQALRALDERRMMLGLHDDDMLLVERDKYVDWVNLIVEGYQGSFIDEFRVRFDLDENHRCDIDKWVYFAIEKEVKRLVMDFRKLYGLHRKGYSFPPLCDISKSLHHCRSLIALELNCVNISGGVVEYFIASCPYLRQLSVGGSDSPLRQLPVEGSDSLVDLKVSGKSLCLEYLKIVNCDELKSIYISAENLVSFTYSGLSIKFSFANVPNLVELSFSACSLLHMIRKDSGELSNFGFQLVTLKLSASTLEGKMARLKLPLLAHLKNFELAAFGFDDESLLYFTPFIEAAPSLARFTLEFCWGEDSLVKSRRRRKTRKHIHQCLKEVNLVGFVGQAIDMEFAMYLLENAITLEKITIDRLNPKWRPPVYPLTNKEWKEMQTIRQRAMKLKSRFSLGDRLVLRNC